MMLKGNKYQRESMGAIIDSIKCNMFVYYKYQKEK